MIIKETSHNTELCECGRRLKMTEYKSHKDIKVGKACYKCDIQWVKKWRNEKTT